ncbi:hypothetical protein IB233_02145 [Comamonas sp. CMM01]|uniref:hypothetical protein n=1 Tax=Comamonas sp. CMM01 TaxID=2769280 RepID=UPI0017871A24|nr:hypothetical protein [Comamonas sp. CMM01]MBD9530433.1 hypothetical protein [Comamonas sp. CMM01]
MSINELRRKYPDMDLAIKMNNKKFQDYIKDKIDESEKKQRIKYASIAAPLISWLLVRLWINAQIDQIPREEQFFFRDLTPSIDAFFIGTFIFVLSYIYLQNGFKKSKPDTSLEAFLENKEQKEFRILEKSAKANLNNEVSTRLETLQNEFNSLKDHLTKLNNSDRSELVAELSKKINSEASKEIIDSIKEQVESTYLDESRKREINSFFKESRARLGIEIYKLGQRGNVNLAIGVATTAVGLYLLGTGVVEATTKQFSDLWSFTSNYFPRFTLVVMIELFAYFFLSLYKNNLIEIKYFQNELTNVEAKQISLQTAISFGDPANITDVISKLSLTERNHILSKEQTTVELEKAKIDRDSKGELIRSLSNLLKVKLQK